MEAHAALPPRLTTPSQKRLCARGKVCLGLGPQTPFLSPAQDNEHSLVPATVSFLHRHSLLCPFAHNIHALNSSAGNAGSVWKVATRFSVDYRHLTCSKAADGRPETLKPVVFDRLNRPQGIAVHRGCGLSPG